MNAFFIMVFTTILGLLEGVLFANIRFHDTVSRGRLLNRFGKDFEGEAKEAKRTPVLTVCVGVDSSLPDNFGRSMMYGLSAVTTYITITFVGGWPFFFAAIVLMSLYYSGK